MVWNAMLVNGDQRHGLGGGRVAQPGDDARPPGREVGLSTWVR
jgi:hypothetical protein